MLNLYTHTAYSTEVLTEDQLDKQMDNLREIEAAADKAWRTVASGTLLSTPTSARVTMSLNVLKPNPANRPK
ncbi:MAG TPA: hypothetical protein VGQ21_06775 [Thermoanaerobaculia bacterium]|jgi:hypothetical protein|nr:hypothetical protein [Thermoanaerobaculia bacterium]